MNERRLIELRRTAEAAVADMPEGDLKLKAFEVILARLLDESPTDQGSGSVKKSRAATKSEAKAKPKTTTRRQSVKDRILALKDEGFFKNPRVMGEIQEELRVHGWHYPQTSLSGPLPGLVRKRDLRSVRGQPKVPTYGQVKVPTRPPDPKSSSGDHLLVSEPPSS